MIVVFVSGVKYSLAICCFSSPQTGKFKQLVEAAAVAQQRKDIAALTIALKAQAAQTQKVSNQLRRQVPVPRVVAND